jgi:methylmalonyl-CoA/ethylmalonyl-CoA epimerase
MLHIQKNKIQDGIMLRKAYHSIVCVTANIIFIIAALVFVLPQAQSADVTITDNKSIPDKVASIHQLKINDSENYKFNEIAIVVKDIKKAVEYYTNSFGLHFEEIKEYKIDAIEKGKPNSYTQAAAFAKLGPTEIELIQIVKGESIHTEFLKTNGEGVHHLGFMVKDLEKEMINSNAMGLKLISSFEIAGVMVFAYYEKTNGIMIELVQENVRDKIAAAMKEAKQNSK